MKKIILSVCALLLSAMICVGTTFAWFVTMGNSFFFSAGTVDFSVKLEVQVPESGDAAMDSGIGSSVLKPDGSTADKEEVKEYTEISNSSTPSDSTVVISEDCIGNYRLTVKNTSDTPGLFSVNLTELYSYLYMETTEAFTYYLNYGGKLPDIDTGKLDEDTDWKEYLAQDTHNCARLLFSIQDIQTTIFNETTSGGTTSTSFTPSETDILTYYPFGTSFSMGNWGTQDLGTAVSEEAKFIKGIPLAVGEYAEVLFSVQYALFDLALYEPQTVSERYGDLACSEGSALKAVDGATDENIRAFLKAYATSEVELLSGTDEPVSLQTEFVVTWLQQPRPEFNGEGSGS